MQVLIGKRGPGERGLELYDYLPDQGHLKLRQKLLCGVQVGVLRIVPERGLVYLTDETDGRFETEAGGGYVIVLRMEPGGQLSFLQEVGTGAVFPAGLALSEDFRHLMVVHHATERRVIRTECQDGRAAARQYTDSVPLQVYRLNGDGTVGELCQMIDYRDVPGDCERHRFSHLHWITALPGNRYAVCDKGRDRIYTFHLDEESHRLCPGQEIFHPAGYHSRYLALHPRKPWLYCNGERSPVVCGYRLAAPGQLDEMCRESALPCEPAEPTNTSDIKIHPDGRTLYLTLRTGAWIAALHIAEDGSLSRLQLQKSGGKNPRGICISPDGKYLFVTHVEEGGVVQFAIASDGTIRPTGYVEPVEGAANMEFIAAVR